MSPVAAALNPTPTMSDLLERRFQKTGDAGALVLIPSLYYLFRIFKSRPS